MPEALSILAPLLLAAVLVISAIGKLRDPAGTAAGFEALEVPRPLRAPTLVRAHPWAEIVLAALLLVTSGPLGVLMACFVLTLMLVYLLLVARAVRRPVDVDCACFGSLGEDHVTKRTVVRNAWLSALAVVAVVSALDGPSVLTRLSSMDASDTWWLIGSLGTAVTVVLVLGTGGRGSATAETALGEAIEEGDYVRTPTPAVAVTLADGSPTDLRRLSARRAQLLLYVSEGCGSCREVIDAVPAWRATMSQIDVRLITGMAPTASSLTNTDAPMTAHDPERLVRESFGISAVPSAVLLGADGMLAGGPVTGRQPVMDFVTDVEHELSVASADVSAG